MALFGFCLRISFGMPVTSDGANIAAQAWDLLHGHLLMHGWVVADASYYTFEIPLLALSELIFGLNNTICHVASALTYVIVVAFAAALARADSRGLAALARPGVVVAIMAAPLLTQQGVSILLEAPQHIGTSVFLLASFLLVHRAPGRRFTPPLLAVILCLGQLGDASVLYVAVPAVVLVSAYRTLAARKLRTADAAIGAAAVVSVPLEYLIRVVIDHLGGYWMIRPTTVISPVSQWPGHVLLTLRSVCTLFGSFGADVLGQGSSPAGLTALFGLACLLAAAFGVVKVLWTWKNAGRADQLLLASIVVYLAVYTVSNMPSRYSAREIAMVLACGAALAGRTCVPHRIGDLALGRSALLVAALAAVLPLAAAAVTLAPARPPSASLATWLQARGLTYGIGGYWNATALTLQSHGQVQVRAVVSTTDRAGQTGVPPGLWWGPGKIRAFYWETKLDWYNAAEHDATFVIAGGQIPDTAPLTPAEVRYAFGQPSATYRVAGLEIMVYRANLLRRLGPPLLPGPLGNGL